MYRETDAVTALAQYGLGRNGIALCENGEVWPIDDMFKQIAKTRFIIDFQEEKPEPETAVAVPLAEMPEVKHRVGKRKADGQAEKEILEAWKGGDRSIKEIMEITGYSYPTMRKYIPINEKG